MWTQTRHGRSSSSRCAEIASSKSRALAGSIVNVGSARRSRRPPLAPTSTCCRPRAPRARPRDRTTAAARGRSSAPRSRRAPRRAGRAGARSTARPPARAVAARGAAGRTTTRSPSRRVRSRLTASRGPGSKNGSATRNLPRRSITATRRRRRRGRLALTGLRPRPSCSATVSAWSSGPCAGCRAAYTLGGIPAPSRTPPPPRLLPVRSEVLADGDVERAAVGSGWISWKTPLPYVCVPTTFARPRSLSAPVTISAADAVPRSTSTTIGILGAIASPLAMYTWRGWLRPSVETIVPSGMKMLATLTASSSRPPPLLAEVEDQRLRALAEHLLDLGPELGAGAVGEAVRSRIADLDAVVGDDDAARDRHDEVRAGDRDDPACAAAMTVSVTCVPARPLISREAKSRSGRRATSGRPGRSGRRRAGPARPPASPGTPSTTRSPSGSGSTSIPIPLRCGSDCVQERLVVGRVEVVRVRVVETRRSPLPGPC